MTVPPGGPPKAVIDSSVLVPILTYQFPSTNWLGCVDKWVFIPSCEGVLQVRYVPTLAHFVRIAFGEDLVDFVLKVKQKAAPAGLGCYGL